MLWGREILHLKLSTVGANTFKPLPVLFTLPFALFGEAQPDLWLAVARAGALFAVVMTFKLAARLTVWLGAGPGARHGVSRLFTYGPAVLAGGIAAFSMLISGQYIRDAALGYSECLGAGLLLLAVDRHLDDKPRQAFVIGFFPALDRPEIWAFWSLYGLYLWRRDPGARKWILGLLALAPVLWLLPELWGSGHLFRGVTRALHPARGAPTFAKCPFCAEMRSAPYVALLRNTAVSALLALGAVIAVFRALRRRTTGFGEAVREQAHRPEGVLLVLAVMAIAWFVEISAMTQMGFSGNQRYLIIGGALLVILAGVGWGLVAWRLGALLGRWIHTASGMAVALVAASAVFLYVPDWVGVQFNAHQLDQSLRYQAELRTDLNAIIKRAGGARKLLACGTIETDNYQVQMVAWYLGIDSVDVSGEPSPSVASKSIRPDPNVILQARDTTNAALEPRVPKGIHYSEIGQRTFRLFEHCA